VKSSIMKQIIGFFGVKLVFFIVSIIIFLNTTFWNGVYRKFHFLANLRIFGKIANFWQICEFLAKLRIFGKFANFWQNCEFLANLRIFGKIANFWQICEFLAKLRIFGKFANFWQNCEFLARYSVTLHKFHAGAKKRWNVEFSLLRHILIPKNQRSNNNRLTVKSGFSVITFHPGRVETPDLN